MLMMRRLSRAGHIRKILLETISRLLIRAGVELYVQYTIQKEIEI